MKYINYLTFLLLSVLLISCESIDDTYSEWRGDGKIRYTGKVNNLVVKAGWKRFHLTWENSFDSTVDKIKIKWISEGVSDSVSIDGNLEEYYTEPIFTNSNYEFIVTAINIDDNESMTANQYSRAYDENHEEVIGALRLEKKYFYLKDNLIIFWNPLIDDTNERTLEYMSNGQSKKIILTDDILKEKYYVIENIDSNSKVKIKRSGVIEDCFDRITFPPYDLDKSRISINSDFAIQVKELYNIDGELTINNIKDIKKLIFDFDLISLEDILYFPNLERVELGSGRYFNDQFKNNNSCRLSDIDISVEVLNMMKDINDIDLHVYNNHFNIKSRLNFAEDKGNPVLPDLEYLNISKWEISLNTDKDEGDNFTSNPEYLLDNNVNTVWQPLQVKDVIREHIFDIDMKEYNEIKGFLVRQPKDWQYQDMFFPISVEIMFSDNKEKWEKPFYFDDIRLGKGRGESRILNLPEKVNKRYVRLIVKDMPGWRNQTYLADFLLF